MWTCATCEDVNSDDEGFCAVCGRPRPTGGGQPVATVPTPAAEPAIPPAPFTAAPDGVPLPDDVPPPGVPLPGVPLPDDVPPPGEPLPGVPPPGEPGPPPGRRPGTGMLILLVVLVGILVAGAIALPRLLRSGGDPAPVAAATTPTATRPAEPEPTPAGTTTASTASEPTDEGSAGEPAPTAVGLVRIGPGVTGDRATDIATMFDAYFGGINAKNYDQVGSVLDPAGSIDPSDAGDMADLERGTRTTRDSDISLNRVRDAGGQVRAEVTFRSDQESGDGPRGRTGETCTRWDIAYTLSVPVYRIVRSTASSEPC